MTTRDQKNTQNQVLPNIVPLRRKQIH